MEIVPYSPDHFEACVGIFKSNLDLYFADYELAEFETFLREHAHQSTYYVALKEDQVVGCGGFDEYNDKIVLTWGMIHRDLHGRGLGRALTQYRLDGIKHTYPGRAIKIDTSQHSQGFYQKQGFVLQEIEKDGFAPGLDKYIMVHPGGES